MNHRATRRILLAGLPLLALLAVAYAGRRMLLMSAPACLSGRWRGCFETENGIGLVCLSALPLAALAVAVLALVHRAGGAAAPWRAALAEVGMVYGILPWVWITLVPSGQPGAVSLVPLRDLATMDAGQIVGNLLVLAALGFFAPVRFARLASLPRILALGAACSALIETAQYVLDLGRVTSVDDVLLNAAGAGLAALASRRWWAARRRDRGTADGTTAKGAESAGGVVHADSLGVS